MIQIAKYHLRILVLSIMALLGSEEVFAKQFFLQSPDLLTPIRDQTVKAAALMDPGNALGNKNYPIALKNYPFMIIWSSYFRAQMKGTMSPKSGDKEFILTPNLDDIIFSNHINFTDYSTLSNIHLRKKHINPQESQPNWYHERSAIMHTQI